MPSLAYKLLKYLLWWNSVGKMGKIQKAAGNLNRACSKGNFVKNVSDIYRNVSKTYMCSSNSASTNISEETIIIIQKRLTKYYLHHRIISNSNKKTLNLHQYSTTMIK